MFKRTRLRLAVYYTAIFTMFLVLFIMIFASCMGYLTYWDRKSEIKLLAKEIASEQYQPLLQYYQYGKGQEKNPHIEENRDISGLVFYTVVDHAGNIIKSDNPIPVLQEIFRNEITDWVHHQKNNYRLKFFNLSNGKKAVLMFTSKAIMAGNGELLGRVYIARDITADYSVLLNAIKILSITAIIFITISAGISYWLAGSVMQPVFKAFEREKKFLADVSHELRTPLSILLTSLDMLEADKKNRLTAYGLQIIRDMQDEIKKLTRIISDLLMLARTDCGEIRLTFEEFSIQNVAEQVIRALQMTADRKNVQLTLNTEKIEGICGDREKIRQLLFILIDNAIKYNKNKGTVNVDITTFNDSVQKMKIIVADTGIGISQNDQEQIFKRFFRSSDSKMQAAGNGLGLAIAKWITDVHEGVIKVHSELGKGSNFQVTIPCNLPNKTYFLQPNKLD
ncbi:sensor histidine kinase [Pectinatus frisingensis]|uniref:sensor histidine kinase n=1 Tax=Pectinatus frisingensis TaxID=865 RepID=UPI0018C45E4A|nr:HAMP domain-containing sensor histidine kinase [Pectinatus frisingensis]